VRTLAAELPGRPQIERVVLAFIEDEAAQIFRQALAVGRDPAAC
jgi:hypothetical protein